ncbi:MAG: nuclease-related domain-containing protein [Planctomycetaceae bacterium]|nr:NERD domain-containing protein [Planctomycetaceae bacterium]
MAVKKPKRDLPFDQPLLPQAGQSTREKRDKILGEKVDLWVAMFAAALMMIMVAWMLVLSKSVVQGALSVTGVAVALIGVCIIKIGRGMREARSYSLGAKGEVYVSQCLDKLKANGWRLFEDVPNEKGNVDHVLVGPGGIFTIETKTHSRKDGKKVEVTFDGQKVAINGFETDEPIRQAFAEAGFIKNLVGATKADVQPVLIYVGAIINYRGDKQLWVMHENKFLSWMETQRKKLDPAQVSQACTALDGYIQGQARAKLAQQ